MVSVFPNTSAAFALGTWHAISNLFLKCLKYLETDTSKHDERFEEYRTLKKNLAVGRKQAEFPQHDPLSSRVTDLLQTRGLQTGEKDAAHLNA